MFEIILLATQQKCQVIHLRFRINIFFNQVIIKYQDWDELRPLGLKK